MIIYGASDTNIQEIHRKHGKWLQFTPHSGEIPTNPKC
jgi:hypothetical protein